jgi:hypothetical protein
MVRGIQSQKVVSTMKHYGIYSDNKGAREGFARCDPQCGPREAEYVHLWAFERVIKHADPLGVMASYNDTVVFLSLVVDIICMMFCENGWGLKVMLLVTLVL